MQYILCCLNVFILMAAFIIGMAASLADYSPSHQKWAIIITTAVCYVAIINTAAFWVISSRLGRFLRSLAYINNSLFIVIGFTLCLSPSTFAYCDPIIFGVLPCINIIGIYSIKIG